MLFLALKVHQAFVGGTRMVRTRIPVWLLEQAGRLGASDSELLRSYPTLRAEDLANANYREVRKINEQYNNSTNQLMD